MSITLLTTVGLLLLGGVPHAISEDFSITTQGKVFFGNALQ